MTLRTFGAIDSTDVKPTGKVFAELLEFVGNGVRHAMQVQPNVAKMLRPQDRFEAPSSENGSPSIALVVSNLQIA